MSLLYKTRYTTVIGLEIHAELLTATKLFCGCPNVFGSGENENVCPGCLGLPGTLPALNRAAVDLAIKGGLVLGCDIARYTLWDRKSYFYADLPNGYQITQMFAPLCIGGGLDIGGRFISLDHIHLEEDAGKLIHDSLRNNTRMDFNRGGVPLIEIVTKPDMRSAEEAVAFVEKVRMALLYAGVCDGRMEQGRLRVDANISVMPEGSQVFGTRVEVKNLNSFRNVAACIEYEAWRQIRTLEEGGTLRQETRRFIDGAGGGGSSGSGGRSSGIGSSGSSGSGGSGIGSSGIGSGSGGSGGRTAAMREKENADDYRYFPDYNIPPLEIDSEYIEMLRASLPEPPSARRTRYINAHNMSESDADTILARKGVSDLYDGMVALGAEPREALGIVRGEVLRNIGERDDERADKKHGDECADKKRDDERTGDPTAKKHTGDPDWIGISPADAVRLMHMNKEGKISANNMKRAVGIMMRDGVELDEVVKSYDMLIHEDPEKLAAVVRDALAANPAAVASYKAGEAKVFGYFMGQCNKVLKGAVQPQTLQKELKAQLDR